MKLLLKTTLYTLALGASVLSVGTTYAGNNTNNCGGDSGNEVCNGEIPITVYVPERCELETGDAISFTANGLGSSDFKVTSNASYNLLLTTAGNGTGTTSTAKLDGGGDDQTIPINVITSSSVNPSYNLDQQYTGIAKTVTDYTVKVSTSGLNLLTTDAGTYRDTYFIRVSF
ncbi:hypothetical protein [Acinetobacter sp. CAAS 2-6]|uniref:hypothetical protein n=1 Tax=Acinetobacter sp. CAAS 2-6 TaxID=3016358 RepID=UPI002DD651E5|nr:hypothetical protein [Acinetobacter sp. CAAS 2-6]